MFKNFSPSPSFGLSLTSTGIQVAQVLKSRKKPILKQLVTLPANPGSLKQFPFHSAIVSTAVSGKEVLIRSLSLPVTKEKDIESALPFQIELVLPYPIDDALLDYEIVSKTQDTTDLTCFAVRKETLDAHLKKWEELGIEPEKVGSVPSALAAFGQAYLEGHHTYLMLHMQNQEMTCILMKDGKLAANFSSSDGLELLSQAHKQSDGQVLPQTAEEWEAVDENRPLGMALKRLQREVMKMAYALSKERIGENIEGIVLTGEGANWKGLASFFARYLQLSLLKFESDQQFSNEQILSYAVPIGLSLDSASSSKNFRKGELAYSRPWKRIKGPLAAYVLSMGLLTLSCYFLGQQYLDLQENQIKENYVELLAQAHRSHEKFEEELASKNPQLHEAFDGQIPKVDALSPDDLSERLLFLQKTVKAQPESFALFANTPRVSDLLAWLSTHPAITYQDKEGNTQSRIQIENLLYVMNKRPQQGKKQEKYQVKVELEFSSPTPKGAREFHDALITPNPWVDPKGEVKWNSNHGKYKTSFFLKDKTVYPSGA